MTRNYSVDERIRWGDRVATGGLALALFAMVSGVLFAMYFLAFVGAALGGAMAIVGGCVEGVAKNEKD